MIVWRSERCVGIYQPIHKCVYICIYTDIYRCVFPFQSLLLVCGGCFVASANGMFFLWHLWQIGIGEIKATVPNGGEDSFFIGKSESLLSKQLLVGICKDYI